MTDQPTPDAAASTTQALVLEPPKPVAPVAPDQAAGVTGNIDPAAASAIDAQVNTFVDQLLTTDPHSPQFQSETTAVSALGDKEIRDSSEVSNRMLQRPVKVLKEGGLNTGVAKGLVDLREQVQKLDPGPHGLDGRSHKILGHLPFVSKAQGYFDQYKSAQSQLDAILTALRDGQDELRKDNASIEQEKSNLWNAMQALQKYAYMAQKVDDTLTAKIAEIETTDADRAKTLKDDILFPVRQRRQDILTQLAVSAQGFLALDVVKQNNQELIKGVDRATTTTVAALRTAVIVAQALGTQKLVLDQVNAVNTTTGNLIESTSELMRTQSTDIQQQASSAVIATDKLHAAFENIYATLDAIDTYKVQALDTMRTTVNSLTTEVNKSQAYLDRVQGQSDAPKLSTSGDSAAVPAASSILSLPGAAPSSAPPAPPAP